MFQNQSALGLGTSDSLRTPSSCLKEPQTIDLSEPSQQEWQPLRIPSLKSASHIHAPFGKISNTEPTSSTHHSLSQHQEITDLRIKIAVLENDLAYSKRDKDAVVNSLGIVIGSLTRAATNVNLVPSLTAPARKMSGLTQHDGDLYLTEVDQLRKENKVLKKKVEDLEREAIKHHSQYHSSDLGSDDDYIWSGRRERDKLVLETSRKILQHHAELRAKNNAAPSHLAPQVVKTESASKSIDPMTLAGSWGFQPAPSFGSNSSIIPNTPGSGSGNRSAVADVGLHSLEDELNDNFQPKLEDVETKAAGSLDDVRDIDEQVVDNKKAMEHFLGMPKPGVIKTGFELKGTFRGEEYDHEKLAAAEPKNMQDFNRFANPLYRDPTVVEANAGSGPNSSTSKDRSYNPNLWRSPEERSGAVLINMQSVSRTEARFPDFFRYGIQYQPAEIDSNYIRTVHINNIPFAVTLREVLERVRGGEILSATLMDTKKLLGSMSARVVFKHESAAEEYSIFAADYNITFGDEKQVAEVRLIETPTFPPCGLRLVGRNSDRTRCLIIRAFPDRCSINMLQRDLACGNPRRADALLELYIDEDGTLHMQFSSADMAGSAFAILRNWSIYRNLDVTFEADPCDGPLEELLEEAKPRPPMFPRGIARPVESMFAAGLLADQDVLRPGMTKIEQKQRKITRGDKQMPDWDREDSDGSDEYGSYPKSRYGDTTKSERKPFAARTSQKVDIPNFSGSGLKSSSWADEVNEELDENLEVAQSSANERNDTEKEVKTGSSENISKTIDQDEVLPNGMRVVKNVKPYVGLAGSRFASPPKSLSDHLGIGDILKQRTESSNDEVLPHSMRAARNLMPYFGPTGSCFATSLGDHLGISIISKRTPESSNDNSAEFNKIPEHDTQVPTISDAKEKRLRFEEPDVAEITATHAKLSASPPRVHLDDLLTSSSSSISSCRSDSHDIPIPGVALHIPDSPPKTPSPFKLRHQTDPIGEGERPSQTQPTVTPRTELQAPRPRNFFGFNRSEPTQPQLSYNTNEHRNKRAGSAVDDDGFSEDMSHCEQASDTVITSNKVEDLINGENQNAAVKNPDEIDLETGSDIDEEFSEEQDTNTPTTEKEISGGEGCEKDNYTAVSSC